MITTNVPNKTRYRLYTSSTSLLSDTLTPVSIYLKVRDQFPNAVMLESSDYHGNENSYSFIGLAPMATFEVQGQSITQEFPDGHKELLALSDKAKVMPYLQQYVNRFILNDSSNNAANKADISNGLFGYMTYDAVQYFENISFETPKNEAYSIPEMRYSLYRYVIAINHFKNTLTILENRLAGEPSAIDRVKALIFNRNYAVYDFETVGEETSNISDRAYIDMVLEGKKHCKRGDVFQIVLSRQFAQQFKGDDFNVYRSLRAINPSPYLFYFDYGSYKIFGSSPEAQITIKNEKATIYPIAGTFKRTGNDIADKALAEKLVNDPKENAEHVMLVDLARNDLSRACKTVEVTTFREVQYYSHVIHLVSKVAGKLQKSKNFLHVVADSFPAGTLSGAPKYKAMQLIDKYENQNRSYYGGAIGHIGFDNSFNHAIMIRSFLSKNNTLYYQAGAGIVSKSDEVSELQEVNNKLAALKKAITQAAATKMC
jgi:anthranilate synthase component 1